jgi:SAM-dependent methyltransferase
MSSARPSPPVDCSSASPCLRARDGRVLPVAAERWVEPVTAAERRLLQRVEGPVLDIGCGPARHALALAESGIVSLGIDISRPALAIAVQRGAPVLHRSIFDRVPGHGRWGTALLLDGNVGIGGDPPLLMRRVATLLRASGRVLVEVGPPGTRPSHDTVRFEHGDGAGPWFDWAEVGVDHLPHLAYGSGMRIGEVWSDSQRWFAQLGT